MQDPCLDHPKTVATISGGGNYEAAAAELDKGLAAQEAGDPMLAQEHLQKAVEIDPGLGLAYLTLAEVQLFLGTYPDERAQNAARAILLLPENPRAQLRYAETQRELENGTVAALHARCAVQRRPDYAEAHQLVARIERDANRLPSALVAAKEVTRLSPDDHTRWVLRAEIEEAMGNFKDAAHSMKKAAEGVAKSAPLFRRAAELATKAGDSKGAQRLQTEADRLAPPPPERKLRPLKRKRRRRKR